MLEGHEMRTIPGFTAEASLYRAGAFYARLWLADATLNATEVVPQIQRLYAFLDENGCACLGVEDDAIGLSYVAGCVCA